MNIISGPISLIFDAYTIIFYSYISIGGICKIFKILTIPKLRGVISGAINIVYIIIPPFLAIIGIIYILSIFAANNL